MVYDVRRQDHRPDKILLWKDESWLGTRLSAFAADLCSNKSGIVEGTAELAIATVEIDRGLNLQKAARQLEDQQSGLLAITEKRLRSNRTLQVDWKYTRIYNPQRRLRILVERCRTDSSQFNFTILLEFEHYDPAADP
ncbi:hypothetical protein TNCV_3141321 [Trichonephila clavipes]|nr:hypothetical protein TNCV_3141321 [Trichonephila clavipes]